MLKIGDKVIYGAAGVMEIADIREESIGDVSRSYYVLRSAISRSESLTFVPADNDNLVSYMRPLLTPEQIDELLSDAKTAPALDWIPENRHRADVFKKIMESGDRLKMIMMIRAIEDNGARRVEIGKKNFLADDNARLKAQKLLCTEFSIVLGITEQEAETYISERLK